MLLKVYVYVYKCKNGNKMTLGTVAQYQVMGYIYHLIL